MRLRRKFAAGLTLLLLMGLAGCETLPKKFVRKKKVPVRQAAVVYLEEGDPQKQFSNEYYYKTHYTLWKSWHDDIITNLGGNSKKLQRTAEEAYSHLEQMGRYLKPEKQAELQPRIEEMARYRARFDQGGSSRSDAGSMRSDLERIKRLVANDFYFEKVKNEVLPDVVDLGDAAAP